MSKLVILPTVDKNTQPNYHLKSDYPQINFSEFNEKRDYDFEEKNSSENYSQITIIPLIQFLLIIQNTFVVLILLLLWK
ncbi:MAG: hypothetical protein ACOVOQ_05335 [Flavobacterium sp.]